jgi:hypothetical protein
MRQHGHDCGSNPMDRIGETMDGQWLLKIHQKNVFLLLMKMGTAWDGIYRRKILRTGVMSEVRPLDAFGTAVPQLA